MNTLTDIAVAAVCENGFIVVRMESGEEIRFPVAENPRLARGTQRQLNHMEISPFGLHWPELDEDLSFRGLREGNHGQFQKKPASDSRHSALA
ncbi:MAG TPA: DUF2442 domain-containing protein [Verrucomicrobiae bacterium]